MQTKMTQALWFATGVATALIVGTLVFPFGEHGDAVGVVAVATCIALLYSIHRSHRRSSAVPAPPPSPAEKLVSQLRSWKLWYAKHTRLAYIFYLSGTLLVIVLTALTSLLGALDVLPGVAGLDGWRKLYSGKSVLIILPALASLVSTAMVQFRVFETWKLREAGRIELEILQAKAKALSREPSQATTDAILKLQLAAIEVDRHQADQFFRNLAASVDDAAGRQQEVGKPSPSEDAKVQAPEDTSAKV